jgi:hypothetical protein
MQAHDSLEHPQSRNASIMGNDTVETRGYDRGAGDYRVNEVPEKIRRGLVGAVTKYQDFRGVIQGPDAS